MKRILKNNRNDLQFLDDWKREFRSRTRENPHYRDLDHPYNHAVKIRLRSLLVREQYYICCYCNCRISVERSHIEHEKPKGDLRYKDLEFAYTNLFASCVGDSLENHCGHKKYIYYNDLLFISPYDEDCEEYFIYLSDGTVKPSSKSPEKANYTIDLLNLNSYKLKRSREATLDEYGLLDENIDKEQVLNIIENDCSIDKNGALPSFYCAIVGYANRLLEEL